MYPFQCSGFNILLNAENNSVKLLPTIKHEWLPFPQPIKLNKRSLNQLKYKRMPFLAKVYLINGKKEGIGRRMGSTHLQARSEMFSFPFLIFTWIFFFCDANVNN